jgi:hypothetical protein
MLVMIASKKKTVSKVKFFFWSIQKNGYKKKKQTARKINDSEKFLPKLRLSNGLRIRNVLA